VSDHDRARELRRRHMHERQAVVFGVLLASLAVAGLGAAALYTDSMSLPFLEREFSVKPTAVAGAVDTYCPPEGALPVPAGEITVDVYNGANIGGLAGRTATDLTDRGFVIGVTENAPSAFTGVARIIYGAAGSAAAYTLQAHLPDAVLQNDARTDALLDLIVGKEYTNLLPLEEVVLDPAAPLVGPEGCTPFAEMTAPAADAAGTEDQPADDQSAEDQSAEG